MVCSIARGLTDALTGSVYVDYLCTTNRLIAARKSEQYTHVQKMGQLVYEMRIK